jgi:translation initiation factor eIF-2B subunit beta
MYQVLAMSEQPEFDYSKQLFSLKQSIIQSVNELIDELETVESSIAAQASEYIDPGDLVLTVGRSNTVEQFLLQAAAKQIHFSVIVAESSLPHQGRALADGLKSVGVEVNCIPDASIFSVMSRVNKVIIGCHAVTANGGIIARGGTLLAAVAAKHYSTPVCVVTGMYKVTPIYPENHEDFNLYTSPHSILPYADGLGCRPNIKLVNPSFDHINASFVNLFVTNVGTHPPTYVYRLLGELYDQEDFDVIKPTFH